MSRLSLRARLVLGIAALLALGLLASSGAAIAIFRSLQLQRIDETLAAPFQDEPIPPILRRLATSCEPDQIAGGLRVPNEYALLLADQTGTISCALAQPSGPGLPAALDPATLAAAAASGQIITLPSANPEGAGWRARVTTMEDNYLVLALSLADTRESVARLTLISTLVGLVILVLAALAGLVVVRIALRPLTAIERTAGEIAAGDFESRIEAGDPDTEVGRLAAALNAMLAEIREAFAQRDRTEARLRQFVADGSHELRTPLTTIRGHAELIRRGEASRPEEVARSVSRIEAEAIRMSGIVEDLLVLARLDSAPEPRRRPVDVLAPVADVVADARVREPGRAIEIRHLSEPPWLDVAPTVLGDDGQLRQVITNLLANALKHTPPGTPVQVEVGVRDDRVRLAVVDHGPGLSPGSETRVFERFYRDDAGRSRSQGGAGLGLAIASGLVEHHDGTLSYERTPGGGATFVVSLAHVP